MQTTTLALILIAIAASAFYFGRERSLAVATGRRKLLSLHSLPGYYGYYTAIWTLLPALGLLLAWLLAEPGIIVAMVVKGLPDAQRSMSSGELNLLVNNIRNYATGDIVAGDIEPFLRDAAIQYQHLVTTSRRLLVVLSIGLATLGGVFCLAANNA